jgi:hypothetical protein
MHYTGGLPTYIMGIPSGREGVRTTLRLMRQLTRDGKKNPAVRAMAVQLTRTLPQKDFLSEIKKLYEFVRDRIRYVRDTRQVETLHTPEIVLQTGQGDCDDKSVLLASLLESIGHPTRFVAVAKEPGKFCHVFLQTRPIGTKKWISLETTEPVLMGWGPANITDAMIIEN